MAAKQKVARPPIEEPSESEPELSEPELQLQLDLDDELQNNFVDEQHFQIGDMPEPESDNIRHSKSLPAPRRPLPPPPPPSKFQQKQVTKRERPVVGLKAITEQDLMQGAAKLRTVKRNFNPGLLHVMLCQSCVCGNAHSWSHAPMMHLCDRPEKIAGGNAMRSKLLCFLSTCSRVFCIDFSICILCSLTQYACYGLLAVIYL